MSSKTKEEFYSVVKDITNNKEFNKLNKELHHGITRYDHSLRVAKWTYQFCELFNIKSINNTTRAALLHDFYIDNELLGENKFEKLS